MKRVLAVPPIAFVLLVACEGTKKYSTTMEVIQAETFTDPQGVQTYGIQLKYAECPGDARRVIRADKGFAKCAAAKAGDKLKAEINATWDSDRGMYRTDFTKLGDCDLKQDRKDEVNYEMVQLCTDIVATGAVVGVHCDRGRTKEQVDKCPWLKRR